MGRVDIIVRQRLSHVLAYDAMLLVKEVALRRSEIAGEAVQRQVSLLPPLLRWLMSLDEFQAGFLTHLEGKKSKQTLDRLGLYLSKYS